MEDTMQEQLTELEKKIQYSYKDITLLEQALIHSSYSNEKGFGPLKSYERLEFLGDAVLQLIISDYLYEKYPDFPEGELTKLRSKVVCESTLADCARMLDLGEYMQFGKGEELTGGRMRPSILADCFESLVAAMYLDGGISHSRAFVLWALEKKIMDAIMGKIFIDYKTRLQEVVQAHKVTNIRYSVVDEEGPDHNKIFHTEVLINDQCAGEGKGHSKKEAEQLAAKVALSRIHELFPE
jgi:ribonuclease III